MSPFFQFLSLPIRRQRYIFTAQKYIYTSSIEDGSFSSSPLLYAREATSFSLVSPSLGVCVHDEIYGHNAQICYDIATVAIASSHLTRQQRSSPGRWRATRSGEISSCTIEATKTFDVAQVPQDRSSPPRMLTVARQREIDGSHGHGHVLEAMAPRHTNGNGLSSPPPPYLPAPPPTVKRCTCIPTGGPRIVLPYEGIDDKRGRLIFTDYPVDMQDRYLLDI